MSLPELTEKGSKMWSCVNCRRRKVRCDRRHPCAPCTRNKSAAECIFPVSGRVPRRGLKQPTQKQTELLGRLRRLEAMVGDLGTQVEQTGSDTSAEDVLSANTARTTPNSLGPSNSTTESPQVSKESEEFLVANNGDMVVGDRFWTVFCKEVEGIFETAHGPNTPIPHFEENNGSSTAPGNQRLNYYHFLLRSASAAKNSEDLHPLPSQMLFLWQIYLENVDPFFKVLHVPTLTKTIRELRGGFKTLEPSMQVLLLAIFLAAIMSLDDEEVEINFNTNKNQLFARYRIGCEQALEKANFLSSPNITVLQALTIYLTVLQHTGEITSAWSLAGVLVRVAVSMKLHVDGSQSPFETEMRRRLWWQICFIDSRSEDTHVFAFKISEGMFNTQMPSNTDDDKLDSGMTEQPIVAKGRWTDMTISLIRCEVWKLSYRLQSSRNMSEMLKLFQQSRARIDELYLKHFDPNQRLHSCAAATARIFLTKVDLILHQTQLQESAQSDVLFQSCLSIVEDMHALQHEPKWSGWRWQIQGRQPPWQALRIVLTALRTMQCPSRERALLSAKISLDDVLEADQRDPRYRELVVLLNRANELQHPPRSVVPLPSPLVSPNLHETYSATTQEPNIPAFVPDEPSNGAFADLSLEMDWQVWDGTAWEMESIWQFWDMGGI